MSWRDRYRAASFRGVAFRVQGHGGDGGGRRARHHQYPGRDIPYAEDLGRNARRYTLDAYVIGADYDRARDALIAACDAAGVATLVHPYLGELTVLCTSCVPREVDREGGMARFSLGFIEAGANRFPAAAADTATQSSAAAITASDDFGTVFNGRFTVQRLPAFVAADAADLAGIAAALIRRAAAALPDIADLAAIAADGLAAQTQASLQIPSGVSTFARQAVDAMVGAGDANAAAQAMKPGEQVCVAAYEDYGPGYIGTEIAYWQGGYETSEGASNVAPEVEAVLMEAMAAVLK